MTISCPSLLQRIKIVLFINLLLNHILYPTVARTASDAVASFGKKQRPSLAPFAAVLGKGKKLAPLGFGWRLPWILNDVDD